MNKELYVTSTPHETKVAMVEDDSLAEIYYERENEYTLAGSIYKGRVTRVLPGMQSAFVDIGLERDAFLYVSDFLDLEEDEDDEDYGDVQITGETLAQANGLTTSQQKTQQPQQPSRPAAKPQAKQPVEIIEEEPEEVEEASDEPAADGEEGEGGARRWRGRRRRGRRGGRDRQRTAEQPKNEQEAPVAQAAPVAEFEEHEAGDDDEASFLAAVAREFADDEDDEFNEQEMSSNVAAIEAEEPVEEEIVESEEFTPTVSEKIDEEETPAAPSRRRSRREPRTPRGAREPREVREPREPREIPEPSEPREVREPREPRVAREQAEPVASYTPIVLPGESITKYQDGVKPEPVVESTGSEEVVEERFERRGRDRDRGRGRERGRDRGPRGRDREDRGERRERRDREPETALPSNYTPIVLPGESINKYRGVKPAEGEKPEEKPRSEASVKQNDEIGFRISSWFKKSKSEDEKPASKDESAQETFVEVEQTAPTPRGRQPRNTRETAGDEFVESEVSSTQQPTQRRERGERGGRGRHGRERGERRGGERNNDRNPNANTERSGERSNDRNNDRNADRGERTDRGERREREEGEERSERNDRGERRGRRPRREARVIPQISDVLKEGQEVLVQIAKEPIGKKGARITSHIALPGRFLVYMPTVNHIGVSRKISSDDERQRLKRIVASERENGHGGFIVRTAAASIDEDELRADIRFLKHLWQEIRTRSEASKSPALIYHDLNLVERVLRDQVTSDFSQIWVDTQEEYERVVRFASRFQPNLVRRIKLYTKQTPLFEQFGLTEEVNRALKSKVWLKSGGYLVINQTEALVAIDINTGKYVGKTTRLEDTIVKTNIEACKEIVRQLRLRDMGGIIIIDFIDMDERKNRAKVMATLEEAMKADRAPSKILQFNDFGLVAITRKRVKQSLERTLGSGCPYCSGTGIIKSETTVANEIYIEFRKIRNHIEAKDVTLRVHPEVAKLLKAGNGRRIAELEELTGHPVIVKGDQQVHMEQFDINY